MVMGMGMIQALNNLTKVMTQTFMRLTANNDTQTTNVITIEK
jgi:hypothetical protein